MSATFAAPVASVMLAVELLLFELKPRSVIPVALASVAAAASRRYLMGMGPIFPVPADHPLFIGADGLAACVLVGLLAGGLSMLLTGAVYASEDAFAHLPIHWMWWPAFGGLAIGIGGYFFPQALGVGYDVIGGLLNTDMPLRILAGVLIVKSVIWSISLGSGTSGGVLAPLLMIGGALGALESHFLPWEGHGFWPLVSMGAILGGTMRSPLTGVIFALELTHDINIMLPLLLAVMIAHGVTVLLLRRSILTEKVARRGFHLSREYAVDPLEIMFAREVVRRGVVALPADATLATAESALAERVGTGRHEQRLFPVVDTEQGLVGAITRQELRRWIDSAREGRDRHRAQARRRVRGRLAARDRVSHGRDGPHAPARNHSRGRQARRHDRIERSAPRTRAHARGRATTRARLRRAHPSAARVQTVRLTLSLTARHSR
jgi:CBS domain-containing protein